MEKHFHTPMRILHLANYCHNVGDGIMNVAVDLACEQAQCGHGVTFVSGSCSGSYVDLLRSNNVTHITIPHHWRRPFTMCIAVYRLNKLIRGFRPDIVHAHMMTGALLAKLLRDRSRFQLVTTVHNEWQRSAILMGVADRVIAVSDAVAQSMAQRGIPARKIRVVKNGPLNSARRPPLGLARDEAELAHPAIITVCGLCLRKGIPDLIEAFELIAAGYPSAKLYIVGEGQDRAQFVAQATASPFAARIIFVGFLKDPRPWLLAADIFVLASRSDPFPLVLAEAREAGCAIVATRVDGIPEALEEGEAGQLVPPNDPISMAATLNDLLAEPDLLRVWRERARRNLNWLSIQRAAQENLEIYAEALRARLKTS